jgi:hypothetical protein
MTQYNSSNKNWNFTINNISSYNNSDITFNNDLNMNQKTIINQGTSDDRLKHNEIIINNGLEIIRQLVPQKYQKTQELLDENYNGDLSGYNWIYESGLIAQDILNINDLSYTIHGGDYIDESGNNIKHPYGVNYNDIHVYNIAAVKELDLLVQTQQTEINSLKNENNLIKSKLNELLSETGKSTI